MKLQPNNSFLINLKFISRLFADGLIRIFYFLFVVLKKLLEFRDLNLNLIMITNIRILNLTIPVSSDAHKFLDLE